MKIFHLSPLVCAFCRSNVCYEEFPVCCDCLPHFQASLNSLCKKCGRNALRCECSERNSVKFLFYYDHPYAKRLVYSVKTNMDERITDFFVEMLFRYNGINPNKYDGIAFVPRSRAGKSRYGHDQALELAKAVRRVYGIEVVDAIERIGKREQKLLSRSQRIKDIKDKYRLKNGTGKKYKRLLLIDDVYTTGATMKVCSELLRGTVAENVSPIVLAKTNFPK